MFNQTPHSAWVLFMSLPNLLLSSTLLRHTTCTHSPRPHLFLRLPVAPLFFVNQPGDNVQGGHHRTYDFGPLEFGKRSLDAVWL